MSNRLSCVCVFAGSSLGARDVYRESADALGTALARRAITLVYGGASVGLMGVVADSTLRAGGRVIGVLPRSLADLEVAHPGLSELRVVDSMHQRKAQMADLADGFVALPGGIGTLEEAFEVWTWSQLGIHHKPIGLLNAGGFYDRLAGFVDHLVAEAFVKPVHRDILLSESDADTLIDGLQASEVPVTRKWIQPDNR